MPFLPIHRRTLFLFDEPTTGLHFDDIATLLKAFDQLLARGHSLVVIRAADWLIDLGPEGGAAGGEVVCVGPPAEVAKHKHSHTGQALRERIFPPRLKRKRKKVKNCPRRRKT